MPGNEDFHGRLGAVSSSPGVSSGSTYLEEPHIILLIIIALVLLQIAIDVSWDQLFPHGKQVVILWL